DLRHRLPLNCHNITVSIRILAPEAGAGLSLEELAMPDLDLIKQGEQACDPPEMTNTSQHRLLQRGAATRLSARPARVAHRHAGAHVLLDAVLRERVAQHVLIERLHPGSGLSGINWRQDSERSLV